MNDEARLAIAVTFNLLNDTAPPELLRPACGALSDIELAAVLELWMESHDGEPPALLRSAVERLRRSQNGAM